MKLLGAFAFIALVLAMLGVYGVMLYATSERTREIGIRIAVGAHPRRVVGLVVRQGMLLVVLGMIIGTLLSVGAGMGMASLFAGISAIEPVPLITTIMLMSGVGLAATLVPALRAARQDPTSALRFE
jgi:ABC-type antimicrobial peptide transport system permease subunit